MYSSTISSFLLNLYISIFPAAHYGKGVYFALNAIYSLSDKYSAVDSDGYKHILVCSLLVCKFTKGNGKMKVPPALPNNPQVNNTLYYNMI